MQQAVFLQTRLVPLLRQIPPDRKPLWGQMNLQQMVEHLSREGFQQAAGLLQVSLVTDAEQLPKMQAFIRSDKAFREHTKNPLMPEIPYPLRHVSLEAACITLQKDIAVFFDVFKQSPEKQVLNPFFGVLDYELSVLLLYKHSLHHLRQFGVEVDAAMP